MDLFWHKRSLWELAGSESFSPEKAPRYDWASSFWKHPEPLSPFVPPPIPEIPLESTWLHPKWKKTGGVGERRRGEQERSVFLWHPRRSEKDQPVAVALPLPPPWGSFPHIAASLQNPLCWKALLLSSQSPFKRTMTGPGDSQFPTLRCLLTEFRLHRSGTHQLCVSGKRVGPLLQMFS